MVGRLGGHRAGKAFSGKGLEFDGIGSRLDGSVHEIHRHATLSVVVDPRFGNDKEYLVHLDGTPAHDEIERLQKGIELDDGLTSRSVIKRVEGCSPFNYSITINEGRKRQVRRMFARIGYRVISLKRVRIGGLRLGNLPEGKVRALTDEEVAALRADNR